MFKVPKASYDLPKGMRDEYFDFIDYLINVRKLDPKNYVKMLSYRSLKIFQYFTEEGYSSVEDADYDDYLNYIQSLGKITRGNFAAHKDAVRNVAEWAWHKGVGEPEIIYKLKMLKTPRLYRKPPPVAFKDSEITDIFKRIDIRFPYDPKCIDKLQRGMNTDDSLIYRSLMNVQVKTLLWAMLELGTRISEVYPLSIDDVDPINETIIVVGKFNKTREIPYSDKLRKEMKTWLAHRELIDCKGDHLWVGCGKKIGEPLKYDTFYKWINRMMGVRTADARFAVLEFKCNWHKFRKTFATRCYEDGMDISVICKILGHESVATTMIYLGIDRRRIINEAKAFEESRAKRYEKAASMAVEDTDVVA